MGDGLFDILIKSIYNKKIPDENFAFSYRVPHIYLFISTFHYICISVYLLNKQAKPIMNFEVFFFKICTNFLLFIFHKIIWIKLWFIFSLF